MKKVAFLFPGQGAQYVGMGKDFCDQFSEAREVFEEADDTFNESLSRLIFQGPSDQLVLTKNSQRAIFVVSMALLRVLQKQFPKLIPSVCAGLSLGEYSAICAAKKISFKDTLCLVKHRALYMQQSCKTTPGTMRAVLGLEPSVVEEAIGKLQSKYPVWVANINCPGQVIISGSEEGIEATSILLKKLGAKRLLSMEVSGAFHSGLMKEAQKNFTPNIQQVNLLDSDIALVMNVCGGYVNNLTDIRENLIQQVTSTVRWEQGVRSMLKEGVDLFIEIGCGKTLSGMNKKIGISPDANFSLDKIEDLEILTDVL